MIFLLSVIVLFFQLGISAIFYFKHTHGVLVFLLKQTEKLFFVLNYFLVALGLLCFFQLLSLSGYDGEWSSQSFTDGERVEFLLSKVNFLVSQRGFLMSLLILIMTFELKKYAELLLAKSRVEISHDALVKQSKGLAEMNLKLHSDRKGAEESSAKNQLLKELEVLKETVDMEKQNRILAQSNLEVMKKQAQAQQLEYTRLLRENEALRNKVEDFQDAFIGSKGKSKAE